MNAVYQFYPLRYEIINDNRTGCCNQLVLVDAGTYSSHHAVSRCYRGNGEGKYNVCSMRMTREKS